MYGIQLATATLTKYNRIAFDALAPFEEFILSQVKIAAVKNMDETGFRVSGKTQWLHVSSTQTETYYHVSPKRKSLLDGLSGTVVNDHWKSYYNLFGVEHGLCNQHHLRELKSIIEHEKEPWAIAMTRLLRVALRCRHSTQGAEQFARIRGFISTVRKRGLNILNSIQSIFSGNMLIPAGY